ncbi:MAG TPA: methionyl-tRNA formyltransferase, partial [Candidatus Dojkabacteria bacterium]|nr:methionyl-tRNA formyltransferase [Candidatus Dojkabacteria bacterium]
WPVVWCLLNGQRVKIFESRIVEDIDLKPGEIKVIDNRLLVGTKEKTIEFLKLQPEGKTVMDAKQYLAGNKLG